MAAGDDPININFATGDEVMAVCVGYHAPILSSLQEALPHIRISAKATLLFGSEPLDGAVTFEEAGLDDGATITFHASSGAVPREGLQLWLTAKSGIGGSLWSNPEFQLGLNCHSRAENGFDTGEDPKLGPYVEFGYDNWGSLVDPAGNMDGLHNGVQTIVSVHSMEQEYPGAQFYIFAGSDQGPLHSAGGNTKGSTICSGDGQWAGGAGFYSGTIRLDGVAKPVAETTVQEFAHPRMAVVLCSTGLENWCGSGMNRIGRDRNCHAFRGKVFEVMVYNRQLSSEEIDQVESYLDSEWF